MISHIDHLVLTVADIEESVAFYKRALLMIDSTFANGRRALHFGHQKINLQVLGMETRNRAAVGSGDLCLVTTWSLADVVAHLRGEGIRIVEGPVAKTGAAGAMMSVYFNDPDGNLIEISSYGERSAVGGRVGLIPLPAGRGMNSTLTPDTQNA